MMCVLPCASQTHFHHGNGFPVFPHFLRHEAPEALTHCNYARHKMDEDLISHQAALTRAAFWGLVLSRLHHSHLVEIFVCCGSEQPADICVRLQQMVVFFSFFLRNCDEP